MEEKPIDHPGVPEEQYHRLGKKTFWIFFLERVQPAAIFLLVTIALFAIKDQSFLKTVPVIGDLRPYMSMLTGVAFMVFVVIALITWLVAWLIYANYKFCLGEDALKIKQGIFNKTETAIPYRQIQDVDIERDLSFQMLGLSRLVILTAGHEEEKDAGDESEGILPALDSGLAEWLQQELLRRADVQRVTETAPEPPAPGAPAA